MNCLFDKVNEWLLAILFISLGSLSFIKIKWDEFNLTSLEILKYDWDMKITDTFIFLDLINKSLGIAWYFLLFITSAIISFLLFITSAIISSKIISAFYVY